MDIVRSAKQLQTRRTLSVATTAPAEIPVTEVNVVPLTDFTTPFPDVVHNRISLSAGYATFPPLYPPSAGTAVLGVHLSPLSPEVAS